MLASARMLDAAGAADFRGADAAVAAIMLLSEVRRRSARCCCQKDTSKTYAICYARAGARY